MAGVQHWPRLWKQTLILSALVLAATSEGVRAQMTPFEADARIHNMQAVFNAPVLKRVLTATHAELARYIGANEPLLARYAMQETHRRNDHSLVPALAARIADHHGDTSLSTQAAIVLGFLNDAAARSTLHKALQDPRIAVRSAACLALAPTGDRAVIPDLREALDRPTSNRWNDDEHPYSDVRIAAASFLSIFMDRQSEPHILRLVGRLNEVDRRLICTALGRFRDPTTQRKLRSMLASEPYAGTRAHAALALGVAGNRSAVPALLAALKDRSPDVRRAAARSLEMVGDRHAVSALEQAALSVSPGAANAPTEDRAARATAHAAATALSRAASGNL
jgi:HEAT repeat protein